MLCDHDVLKKARSTVVREEVGRFLLFNSATDEMYLIPCGAYRVFVLCNGRLAVGDISNLLASENEELDKQAGRTALKQFLQSLVDRGLLEPAMVRDNHVGARIGQA